MCFADKPMTQFDEKNHIAVSVSLMHTCILRICKGGMTCWAGDVCGQTRAGMLFQLGKAG